ncbi:MAG: chemotaxis protein CheW [Thioalkalispiraceae bacterium]|jgi:chemotaxis-related protein WspB
MLLLSFHIGSERYAVSAKQIIEILPLTSIKRIPRAPAYVAGLLDYRGLPVPVIDLCQLINEQDCSKVLSSRIILINYKAGDGKVHPLGLIAEKVTETLNIAEEHFTSSGISMEGMAYLGGVAKNNGSMVQYIEIDELLSNELQTMLFVDNSEKAGK